MLIAGLMSGTSADGVDAALVEIEGEGRQTKIELREFLCVPYSKEMRYAIHNAGHPKYSSSQDVCGLNIALGELFAKAANDVCKAAGIPMSSVTAVASHGQTIWHEPESFEIGGMSVTGTLQIAEPSVIAARTGCQVISNFRSADMAAGGQGAPLVPYFDWALLGSDSESRAVINIGGMANLTYLPKTSNIEDVLAFDTGPGNVIIDELATNLSTGTRLFDENGAWAGKGTPNRVYVDMILNGHFYFQQSPPKSTGREVFGYDYAMAIRAQKGRENNAAANLMATATLLTAGSIDNAIRDFVIPRGGLDKVIVGGGGVRNKTLMRMLTELLSPIKVTTLEEFGIPNDAKEAMAFALLGYETLHGRPGNVPSATGASRPVVLGSITPAP